MEFSDSTRTSSEAAEAIGTSVSQIAKSMVFVVGDRPVLVITSGANRVSTDKVGRFYEGDARRAVADEVRAATGFPIGGVPPVGHASNIDVLIDEDLFEYDEIWSAAGTPHAVFPTTPHELTTITGGRVADIREEPQ